MQEQQYLFGVIDWENKQLLEEYYPPDLPNDWRLDYYANEYAVVVVPEEKWQEASEEIFEEWHDAGGDELYYVLESSEPVPAQDIATMRKILGRQLLGVVDCRSDEGLIIEKRSFFKQNDAVCVFYIQSQTDDKQYLKELRMTLEELLPSCTPAQKLVFIVAGQSRQQETLASVQILLDLMR